MAFRLFTLLFCGQSNRTDKRNYCKVAAAILMKMIERRKGAASFHFCFGQVESAERRRLAFWVKKERERSWIFLHWPGTGAAGEMGRRMERRGNGRAAFPLGDDRKRAGQKSASNNRRTMGNRGEWIFLYMDNPGFCYLPREYSIDHFWKHLLPNSFTREFG